MGYTEPLRRFIQPEGFTPQVNEIENTMPSWMPGEDYLINFRKGDPYIKVDEGYARLPGAGYEAIHPELEGLDPEDYPDIAKLRILGDVAPYSREYQKISARVRIDAKNNPDLEAEYGRISEQVRQTKESTLQVAQRHFNAPVETIEGTVKSVRGLEVELKEFSGRTLRFSSVGGSMTDMTTSLPRAAHIFFARAGERPEPRLRRGPIAAWPPLSLPLSPAGSTQRQQLQNIEHAQQWLLNLDCDDGMQHGAGSGGRWFIPPYI